MNRRGADAQPAAFTSSRTVLGSFFPAAKASRTVRVATITGSGAPHATALVWSPAQ